jgi:hypothetical protein
LKASQELGSATTPSTRANRTKKADPAVLISSRSVD